MEIEAQTCDSNKYNIFILFNIFIFSPGNKIKRGVAVMPTKFNGEWGTEEF